MRFRPEFMRRVHTRLGEMVRSTERLFDSDLDDEQRRQVEIIRAGADWLLAAMNGNPGSVGTETGTPYVLPSEGAPDPDHDAILAVLRDSFDDDHAAMAELLGIFIEGVREYHSRLARAWSENDLEELKRVVHTLKGSAASFGSGRITALAESIGRRAAAGDFDGLAPLLTALEAQIDALTAIRIPAG